MNSKKERVIIKPRNSAEVPRIASFIKSSQEALALQTLDRIGHALKSRGLSLEELIESGREIRGQMIKEKYGTSSRGQA